MIITTDLNGSITFELTDATSFTKVVVAVAKVTGMSLVNSKAFAEFLWDSDSGSLTWVA